MPDSLAPHEFKQRLLRRYFVRFHMALLLFAVIMSGVLASRLLLVAGVLTPIARYPASVAISYCVFLGLVRLWILFVNTNQSASAPRVLRGVGEFAADTVTEAELAGFVPTPSSGGGSFGGLNLDFDIDDGWFIVLALVMLIGAILGSGAYLIYMAPEILTEAAFQAALASGLSRAIKKGAGPDWAGGLIRGTVLPFVVVMALSMVLAGVMRHSCPSAVRMREAIHCPEMPLPRR